MSNPHRANSSVGKEWERGRSDVAAGRSFRSSTGSVAEIVAYNEGWKEALRASLDEVLGVPRGAELGLPPAASKPCSDCPWRRASAPGWLGPMSPEEWLATAHSDQPIACHLTIRRETWTDPAVRQCAGAAIFRQNVAKSPRYADDAAHGFDPDVATVLGSDQEFLDHHTERYETVYEPYRKEGESRG